MDLILFTLCIVVLIVCTSTEHIIWLLLVTGFDLMMLTYRVWRMFQHYSGE